MKIGDMVAIQIKRNRRLVFGWLTSVHKVVDVVYGVVLVNGIPHTRPLKRIKTERVGRLEAKRREERDKKRYRGTVK